ncbi:MAG: hypothetical protein WCD21_25580 [Streptomyces sp.]
MVYLLHTLLLSAADRFRVLLIYLALIVLLTAMLLVAAAGVSTAACLLLVMLAPFVTVLGYETVGRRHQPRMLHTSLPKTADGT